MKDIEEILIAPEGDFARILRERRFRLPVYDLQRFAAEDEGRTEDPSERRQREEREKGNVPRSQDLVGAVVLIGTVVILFFTATYMFYGIVDVFKKFLSGEYRHFHKMGEAEVAQLTFYLFLETAKIIGPILIVAFIMGIIGSVSQVGALFTLQPLAFKPERMIPDFKRILPARRTMYQLGKIMVQVIIISSAAYLVIIDDFIPMLKAGNMALKQAVALFAWVSFKMLLICSIVLFLLAIPDYFYQRFEYIENLKVNISEAKRERKDEEGDPLVRQRQRERGMELRQGRSMMEEVPRADVVITNPTHYAVALQYDPGSAQAPVVLAKGVDHLAFVIRTIARENEVPVRENPVLARTLYAQVETGMEIPEDLYQAVSIIFAQLEKFSSRAAG